MEIDIGKTIWALTSTTLVMLMVPALAMFYAGLVRTKNVLGTMMHSMVTMCIIGFFWIAVGYAFCFGEEEILGGLLGWDWDLFFLHNAENKVVDGIPMLIHAMFQGKFAIITPALISGAMAERVSFRGYLLFIFLWTISVYCPLAHWVWSSDGWMGVMGVIDHAGGLVIHVSAGASALVVAILLGKRRGYPETTSRPNNLVMTLIGAGLLWVGWFGFNSGGLSIADAASALTMTQISAAAGATVWLAIEACIHRKATSLGFATGILAGLVAITPAAGCVGPFGATILGSCSSVVCFIALLAKDKFGYDDSLDCFGVHGVGSGFGVLALAFLLKDGAGLPAMDQFQMQLMGMGITIALSVVATVIFYYLVEKTIGFRLDAESEMAGLDHAIHGEHGYGFLNLD
jgi:Amt family ammonium transporter